MIRQSLILLLIFSPCWLFSQDSVIVRTDTSNCGDAQIIFNNRCVDTTFPVSFVHVHENETTALEAANYMIDSLKKGCFTTWQCQQQRFVDFKLKNKLYRFDPNRIYTLAGVKATLADNGNYSTQAALEVQRIAEEFKEKFVTEYKIVVALHNNTNGGGLSINSYKKGAANARDAKAVFVNIQQDADDFFYTTELAYYTFLKAKGFNVILQNNATVKDDGSLSVFCGEQQIPYLNIEAQEGHLTQQIKMLTTVLQMLEELKSE
jgi:hypothetical protein